MADSVSYIDTQYKADEHYRNVSAWRKSALINIANMGFFSSDRSIADYCRDIWYIKPLSEKELPWQKLSVEQIAKADTSGRCIGFFRRS